MLMMIFILRYIRLSNIKIATVMLMAALAYDVFWVLIQPRLTHSPSVMLMVATSTFLRSPVCCHVCLQGRSPTGTPSEGCQNVDSDGAGCGCELQARTAQRRCR